MRGICWEANDLRGVAQSRRSLRLRAAKVRLAGHKRAAGAPQARAIILLRGQGLRVIQKRRESGGMERLSQCTGPLERSRRNCASAQR
jgi:hypothetical protein